MDGVLGFTLDKFGACHLVLSSGSSLRVSVVDTAVAPRFECFSLALEMDVTEIKPSMPFASPASDAGAFILVREEYIEPYTGDTEGLVGGAPRTIQRAARPGHVPVGALMSCQVAYGLLIEGIDGRLVVAADWFPFKIEATTDEEHISSLLRESEPVQIEHYIERFRVPA